MNIMYNDNECVCTCFHHEKYNDTASQHTTTKIIPSNVIIKWIHLRIYQTEFSEEKAKKSNNDDDEMEREYHIISL